ncbi:MAG TPA: hypothetical protein VJB64_00060, partial [Patescibacteria group bacterium]|nr:hypothetical protein [Patescibacteria group bacterium]
MSVHQYNRQGWSRSGRSHRYRKLLSRIGLGSLTTKNLILLGVAVVFAGSLFTLGFIAFIARD